MEAPVIEAASWGRRILALLIDWLASTLVVIAFVGLDAYTDATGPESFYVLGTYVGESALLTWLVGGSFGKVATRLRVIPASGSPRPLNPLRVLVRQVMIALVIPPLVYRLDGRGLHDLVAGTRTVTLDGLQALRGGR